MLGADRSRMVRIARPLPQRENLARAGEVEWLHTLEDEDGGLARFPSLEEALRF